MPKLAKVYAAGILGVSIITGGAIKAQELPIYETQSGIAGTITSVGSDTMSSLISVWAGEFQSIYPQVSFQLQSSGSTTALPAMVQGAANIGPMSRELKRSEINAFIEKYGYAPTMVPVALDAITLFVDLDNPVSTLTQQQIDAMFSITRFCGAAQSLTHWSVVPGVENYPYNVRLFGRSAVSGTYGLFKNKVMCDGDFKAKVWELPSSSSIVQSVAFFRGAIGYAAWGYQHPGVKILAISQQGKKPVLPTEEHIRQRRYPYTRQLYLLVNKAPATALNNLTLEFIKLILSAEGAQFTRREGYVPLSARENEATLRILSNRKAAYPLEGAQL